MGEMTMDGETPSRESLDWFQKAAAQGNGKALMNIGRLYEGGFGVDKDEAKAVEWNIKACDAGEWLGCGRLSRAYQLGELGLPKDEEQQKKWYEKYIEAQIRRPR